MYNTVQTAQGKETCVDNGGKCTTAMERGKERGSIWQKCTAATGILLTVKHCANTLFYKAGTSAVLPSQPTLNRGTVTIVNFFTLVGFLTFYTANMEFDKAAIALEKNREVAIVTMF